ncbi:polypeptide-transport-associated domain protein, FtsQ-type [gamma proteobacterium HTCC5015]|nr:polypeptide-transport-associated domain protein, FtsQ-type [gamma proteobacterium HTCC5015]
MAVLSPFKRQKQRPQRGAVRRDGEPSKGLSRASVLLTTVCLGVATLALSWWLWPESILQQAGANDVAETTRPMAIKRIEITGERRYLSNEDVIAALQHFAEGEFFEMDIESARQSLMALPWTREVSLRREWPDTLHVQIVEQRPVANWQGEQDQLVMVNGYGETFSASVPQNRLPLLGGPKGSTRRVLEAYAAIREQLGEIGGGVDSLLLDARNTWLMTLRNGAEVRFLERNKQDALARLQLAFRSFDEERQQAIQRIDLRYSNGFAIAWKKGHSDV